MSQEPSESYLPPLPPPPPPPPPTLYPVPPREDPPYGPPPQEIAWHEVWNKAVFSPDQETYRALLSDPRAFPGRAYFWIAAVTTVVYLLQIASQSGWFAHDIVSPQGEAVPLWVMLLCVPFVPLLGVLGAVITTGIQHFVAMILGGVGEFNSVLYLYAAWFAPLELAAVVFQFVPVLGGLASIGLGLYGLALNVQTIRVTHEVDTGRAFLAVCWWLPVCCLCTLWALS